MTPDTSKELLAYTPMLHSRMFTDTPKYRENHFEALKNALPSPPKSGPHPQFSSSDIHLDGNPSIDRPLFVQFCANDPDVLLEAARYVQPFCDAVDLNLGCPQGIARKGRYGAFLQEDWDLIHRLIKKLHKGLDVPVTAKMRILETKEQTLEYAKMILSAGASIITVHGRRREQKGHNTGLADWTVLRYLRDNLPPDTVIFANGNILQHDDIRRCLEATRADAVMSAEGNLCDPSIFAPSPAVGAEGREYWRARDGRGGYRMDAVLRRYMDIIYRYVLDTPPPTRKALFLPSDALEPTDAAGNDLCAEGYEAEEKEPPCKKQKREKQQKCTSPNLIAMQAHLFDLLRPLVAKHTNIRDALAKCRAGDITAFERVLQMVGAAVKQGLMEYEQSPETFDAPVSGMHSDGQMTEQELDGTSSLAAVARCRRPWWVCQPYVRPLPSEALQKGSMTLSNKEKARLQEEEAQKRRAGLTPGGTLEEQQLDGTYGQKVEIPREGMVCG